MTERDQLVESRQHRQGRRRTRPLLPEDGLWWCFYKQQQDKSGKFSKKARMGVPFSVSLDLKEWTWPGKAEMRLRQFTE